jgi:hypothetical protein
MITEIWPTCNYTFQATHTNVIGFLEVAVRTQSSPSKVAQDKAQLQELISATLIGNIFFSAGKIIHPIFQQQVVPNCYELLTRVYNARALRKMCKKRT